MSEGIIIPDTSHADAEVWVTEVHNAFCTEGEYSTLITVIPFHDYTNYFEDGERNFHKDVLDVAAALDVAYQHDREHTISIEVRFKNTYCNA